MPAGPEGLSAAAARTAHQLNGVLTVIGGNAELALLEARALGDASRHSLEQVLEACRKGRELVRALQVRCHEEAAAGAPPAPPGPRIEPGLSPDS
jgi:signal transduction histidine kinase